MTVFSLDPLTDNRWTEFLMAHPESSVFHTREWLQSIRLTYGYEPVVFTTSSGNTITNGVVLCRISSWLTGKRMVSLPFSDHCQPLAIGADLSEILRHLSTERKSNAQQYIEIRPATYDKSAAAINDFEQSDLFHTHTIDLNGDLNQIYKRFHDSCIRRKIKRAEREELSYESGRSDELFRQFRALHLLTRRRHKLPPQPEAWFRNIVRCLGEMVTIHVASKGDTPVASIVTASHKSTLVYKYGVSDGQYNNLGATPFLFWKVIQQAHAAGIQQFDLGRSDYDDEGLVAFKEHLGATRAELRYYRHASHARTKRSQVDSGYLSSWAREALIRLPDSMLARVGQLVYPHIG